MNAKRFDQVQDAFWQALELEPSTRPGFLSKLRTRDPDLAVEVESLLAADARAEGFLAGPPGDVLGTLARLELTVSDAEAVQSALSERYSIERELGHGGMATVYLATDLGQGRRVAIKVVRPDLTGSLAAERFQREIRIAGQLQHPHILPIFESGEAAGFLYYVMPYVEGETLASRLRRERQLPVDDALRITREVADALEYAHGQGVVHRDIKPENILLSGGHALVADFGIAKAVTAAGSDSVTQTGVAVGTPSYMSPEQGFGQEMDGRSDIYSLACVLYEMLAGSPPFTGPNPQVVLARHATDPPPPLRTARPALPPSMSAVIEKALAKTPADRWRSASEFAAALEDADRARSLHGVTRRRGNLVPNEPRPVSLLRVLATYGLVSVALLLGLHIFAVQLGLPNWFFPGAVVVLLVCLPIILAIRALTAEPAGTSDTSDWVAGSWLPHLTATRMIVGGMAAVLLLVGLGLSYTLVTDRAPWNSDRIQPVNAAAPAIAVLPFWAVGPQLELWREGLADLLSTNLDGAAGLRTVDPRAVFTRWAARVNVGGEAGDRETALGVAEALGAQYAVIGSAVELGGGVRLTAEVHDLVTAQRLATVQIEGTLDSVFSLVDELSVQVLGSGLVQEGAALPALEIEQATTSSLPALKAYLQGEQMYRRGDWDSAVAYYSRAVEEDANFALAWYRLSDAAGQLENVTSELAAEYAQRAAALADELPERARLRVRANAMFSERRAEAVYVLEELTRKYPDDVEAWYDLGEAYYHYGTVARRRREHVGDALRRVVELDPAFYAAYQHLIEYEILAGNSGEARRLIEASRALTNDSGPQAFDLVHKMVFGDSSARAQARAVIDTFPGSFLYYRTEWSLRIPERWDRGIEILSLLTPPSRAPVERAYGFYGLGWFYASQGRMREARDAFGTARDLRALPEFLLQPPRLDYLLYHWGYAGAERARLSFERIQSDTSAEAQFFLGAFAADQDRWSDFDSVLRLLERRASQVDFPEGEEIRTERLSARSHAEALRGYERLRRRDLASALAEYNKPKPFLSTNAVQFMHYEIGVALLDNGQLDQAEPYIFNLHEGPFAAPAEFQLGRLYEKRGDLEAAAFYYDRFARWWENCDPELRPWVERTPVVSSSSRDAFRRQARAPNSSSAPQRSSLLPLWRDRRIDTRLVQRLDLVGGVSGSPAGVLHPRLPPDGPLTGSHPRGPTPFESHATAGP